MYRCGEFRRISIPKKIQNQNKKQKEKKNRDGNCREQNMFQIAFNR